MSKETHISPSIYIEENIFGASVKFENQEGQFKIPSALYPLPSGKAKITTKGNTKRITDMRCRRLYDAMTFENGRCFTNSEKLTVALCASGFPALQYVGWYFVGDVTPIFHSYVMCEDHIIDTATNFTAAEFAKIGRTGKGEADLRGIFLQMVENKERKPNSLRSVFGQPEPDRLYIGVPADAECGIKMLERLTRSGHPTLSPVDMNRRTSIQAERQTYNG